jgi:predicted nucleic acid-binding protein
MNATRFLDTNILLYAYDLDAPAKREVALEFLEHGWNNPGETALSVQVLQELHVNLCKQGLSPAEATKIVCRYAAWPVVDTTLDLLQSGLAEQARWQISLWDALILAAARASGATELITEDLNHSQNYDGVKVINPFI